MRPMQPRTKRKHSRRHLAARILREVHAHPSNAKAPTAAVARAVLWQVQKRFGRSPVRRRVFGLDLEFPRHSGSLSNLMYFGECFEWENINFIRSFLRPGDKVLDVGANVGTFAYAAHEVVGATGAVHAFEPMPWAAECIRANVQRCGLGYSIRVYETAVSDVSGSVAFSADLDVSSHIAWEGGIASYQLEVPTERLCQLVDGDTGFALLKVDVEGAEALVLRGFAEYLQRGDPPVVLIEAHDHSLRKMGSSRDEVLAILQENGYKSFVYEVATRRLVEIPAGWNSDVVAVRTSELDVVSRRLRGASR